MYSVKQIFLILSLLSVASAEKGLSARLSADNLTDARRGLKKSSKKGGSKGGSSGGAGTIGVRPPNREGGLVGGSVGGADGLNRDGTTPGQLIQPAGKACIPFDEARVWLTADYPGDVQCRVATGQMTTTSACCRVFEFTDTSGSTKWLLYDSNNQYRDLMCVCNENTGSPGNSGSTPAIPIPVPAAPSAPISTPVAQPVAMPVPATGAAVCSNPNPTQLDLQSRPGVTACVTNTECGGDSAQKCCSVDTCICYPRNFLDSSKCIPAA